MTDLDVIERVSKMFGLKYVQARNDARNPKWKRAYIINVRGRKAAEWMRILRPFMGIRRQGQIDQALTTYVEPRPYSS